MLKHQGSKKIDYQVTIGSLSPKVKSTQSKNNTEARTKSPVTQQQVHKLTQKHQTQNLSLLQLKTKTLKSNKTNSKKQSTESPSSTLKPKDKVTFSNDKPSESFPGKRKRISLSNDKYENGTVPSNYEGFQSPEIDSNKQKNSGSVFDRPFKSKKLSPSLLPAKLVVGTGEKNSNVPVEYSPLIAFRKTKAGDETPKGELSEESKESTAKSKQHGVTIILDDD